MTAASVLFPLLNSKIAKLLDVGDHGADLADRLVGLLSGQDLVIASEHRLDHRRKTGEAAPFAAQVQHAAAHLAAHLEVEIRLERKQDIACDLLDERHERRDQQQDRHSARNICSKDRSAHGRNGERGKAGLGGIALAKEERERQRDKSEEVLQDAEDHRRFGEHPSESQLPADRPAEAAQQKDQQQIQKEAQELANLIQDIMF